MLRWESGGVQPDRCSDPSLLSDYMQGKTSRDWHVTEWRSGVKSGLFRPEEFVGTLGMSEGDVESVFGKAR
jgi:hypothetical protein